MERASHRRAAQVLLLAAALLPASSVSAQTFSDSFSAAASPLWNNFSGNWTAVDGKYYSLAPNSNPTTVTALPFDLTDFTVSVDVTALNDGGIWLRSDGTNMNGMLLVFGGNGYGLGARGGNAGTSLYFHRVVNGALSGQLAQVDQVYVPGQNHSLSITVSGTSYAVSSDGLLRTTLIDSTYSHGQVGLYDFGLFSEPNKQAFSNFRLTGTGVPEPTGLGVLATGAALAARRRRS